VPAELRGAAGKASVTTEVAIVDDHDRAVPPGSVGEIVTRPKIAWTMMTEYWRNPAATAEAFRGCWFHTGDLGYLTADGYLFYVDRKKDALRRKGEMISSWEIETVVGKYPPVAECAVVAVPSELGEDEIMVVVSPREHAQISPAGLIEFCHSRIPAFQIPRYVRILDELPRTQTQRVEKYKLRSQGVTADTWDTLAACPADDAAIRGSSAS
jgi:crotonobetaine/carnitine-CoA ligase